MAERGHNTPIVDSNVHLVFRAFSDPVPQSRWVTDWPEGSSLTIDDYAASASESGVVGAVLVNSLREYGTDNSYCHRASAASPIASVWVGNVDVTDHDAPAELVRLVEHEGMAGARLMHPRTERAGDWLNTPQVHDLWKLGGRLGIPMSAQRVSIEDIPALHSVIEAHPEVTTVVYSMANPTFSSGALEAELAALRRLAGFSNVHVVLSPTNLDRLHGSRLGDDLGLLLADMFGDRMMWGSFSMFGGARLPVGSPSLSDIVSAFEDAFEPLGEQVVRCLLGESALTVYPGLATH